MDKSGNFYGVTSAGGAYNAGALYRLSKSGNLSLLYSFHGGTRDGCDPYGSVVQDEAGNFYGTAGYCGSNNYGTIWTVSKEGKETILHTFAGGTSDGCNPLAGVARDLKGTLYGVTSGCGANSFGAFYSLGPKGKVTLLHSFGLNADGGYPVGEVLLTTQGTLYGTTNQIAGTVWKYVP
jgi:uncharacterized repeat protein (TIGR03803 family)